jgi:conjugative transposon TraN protein
MKIFKTIFFLALAVAPFLSKAQINSTLGRETVLEVYPLEVTLNKTTSIRFPEDIISADVGSIGILADKFEKVENVLRVKANRSDFEDASLTVVTGDSRIYTFVVSYTDNPKYLTIDMNQAVPLKQGRLAETRESMKGAQSSLDPLPSRIYKASLATDSLDHFIKFEDTQLNVATIKSLSQKAKAKKRSVRHLGIEKNDLVFSADGIFIKENVMFMQLSVLNRSHINYDIDLVQLVVRDEKIGKKTSQQEIEIEPILSTDNASDLTVRGKSRLTFTYAIRKLTIPDNKELVVQLFEEDGGRKMEFIIDNKDLIGSLPIEL